MRVCDISGMGGREFGGYEWGCQVIRARALRFLQQQKTESELPKHTEFKNITGVAIAANDKAREMDEFVGDHPKLREFGMTGAMHQYGIAHGKAMFELGPDGYEAELRKHGRGDDDFFEFNEADAFPEDAGATYGR